MSTGERREFRGEPRVALARTGGVDEHELRAFELAEQLFQLTRMIDCIGGDSEQPAEILDLLLGAKAHAVSRDKREPLRPLLQHPPRSQFRDGGRLADTGRPHEGDTTTARQPAVLRNRQLVCEDRPRAMLRARKIETRGQVRDDRCREIARESELRQLAQYFSLDRRATRQVVPRKRRELAFEKLPQTAQFRLHVGVDGRRVDVGGDRSQVCGRLALRDRIGSGNGRRQIGWRQIEVHRSDDFDPPSTRRVETMTASGPWASRICRRHSRMSFAT